MERHRAVLRSRSADRALRRDGYAVVTLLDADAAASLRQVYAAEHGWDHRRHFDGQPSDFEGDVWNRDLEYRQQVSNLVASALEPQVATTFCTHRSIFQHFLVKWPTPVGDPAESLAPGDPSRFHNDSSYLDEGGGERGYHVWVALQDLRADDGALQVVPRSHQLPRTLRGNDIEAPWLAWDDLYQPRAQTLELAAGEAVVFDPATIHRSLPNRSDRPRVAAALLVMPPGQPLAFHRRVDGDLAERVPIEADFFHRHHVDDMAQLPADHRVPVRFPALSRAEAARILDARWPRR